MEANVILGELLYIVSNFEKGRFNTNVFWSREYKNSLRESLFFMLTIVQLMKNDICLDDSTRGNIINFYKKNINIIFCQSNLEVAEFAGILTKLYICLPEDEQRYVISLMDKILNECITLQNRSILNHKHKQQLSLLLKSLHNLPRVFFNSSKQTLCNSYVSALQPSEAISFALSYLKNTTCSETKS